MILPSFFSQGMVIGKTAEIWGWTTPNETITAQFIGKNYEAKADNNGLFQFTLTAPEYGGSHTLTIGDKVITDVQIGRVWLCGGQSNMEERILREKFQSPEDVADDPRIRVFQVEKGMNFNNPEKDVNGKWQAATGDFLNDIYATPYFFARKLLEGLDDNIPIGLICAPAGGTPIEGWLPEEILREFPEYHQSLIQVQDPDFMPKSQKEAETIKNAWVAELHKKDLGTAENWPSPEYNDSNWESRTLLDATDFPERGSVWLRKRITLTEDFLGNDNATLNLGRAEDSITVYVNGKEVTHIYYMYPPCICTIPKNLLTAGENTIALRVVGEARHPAIVQGKEYYLSTPQGKINLNNEWKYKKGAEMQTFQLPDSWFFGRPCGVYNYMLAPLLGYSIEGLIWYQGESNAKKPEDYKTLFTAFVNHFRKNFGEVPIIFTQLANYMDPNYPAHEERWARVREQQRQCQEIPNAAMAVTIDCGEYNDLHPYDKKTVGERLALQALRLAYKKPITSEGPVVTHATLDNGNLQIHFKNAQTLWTKNGYPQLEIIDENNQTHTFYATIKKEILTTQIGKIIPKKIRHNHTDCPSVILYNAYGLPASPFELHM
ncbi:MAG: sialate O-acetylesterase [Defluviitaleaceae bacterium]|nr:sialate O-acetylesterase [Defluviitaleaceae bacterium]